MGRLAEDGLSNMWNSCLLFYQELFAFEIAELCDTQQASKPVKAHAIRQCKTALCVQLILAGRLTTHGTLRASLHFFRLYFFSSSFFRKVIPISVTLSPFSLSCKNVTSAAK